MSTAIETRPGEALDAARIREDFPILARKVHGKPLVYLDNAATSQKPRQVIDAITRFYTDSCANIHRGVHQLSELSTLDYEQTRVKLKRFLNAADAHEIVLLRGASEAVNLVANTFGRQRVGEGDEVVISALEHHSNIVPWQMLCGAKRARLRVIPMNDAGELLLDEYRKLLGPRTRIVALGHVSNALGTINPVGEMIAEAHARGIPVLVDGAQAVPHMNVDVRALDADFYCFSGHKMLGPTGVGVLYGKKALLEEMPPWQGGGDMIRSVTFEETTYNDVPYKFEAGTPNISGGIGLGAAVDYLTQIGMDRIAAYEQKLLAHGTAVLERITGVRILGTAKEKAGVLSFVIDGVHPHDIGTILDQEGIAVRTGHHCAQPVMDRLGVPATTRASLAFYNTAAELDALGEGILKVKEIFG